MAVLVNAVVFLARLLRGIDVHHGHVQVAQIVQEAVVDLAGYGVAFGHRQVGIDRHVHLKKSAADAMKE